MNTNFLIEENDIESAQVLCSSINDEKIRSRSVANQVAVSVAKKFFSETNCEIDTETTLSDIECIADSYEISDVYVNGNYVDVRLYFDEKEICVPKSHFDNEMNPLLYMFVRITNDLTNAEVTGFMLPDSITMVQDDNGYYTVNENALSPFEEIEYILKEHNDLYNVDNKEIFEYIDNTIENKSGFVKKLLLSQEGRIRFKKACKAQSILGLVNIPAQAEFVEENEPEDLSDADFADLFTSVEENNTEESGSGVYNFTTVASPKFNEEDVETTDIDETEPEAELPAEPEQVEENTQEEIQEDVQEEIAEEQAEEIDTLFDNEAVPQQPKKKSSLLPFLLLLAIIGGAGYFGYTKFANQNNELPQEAAPIEEAQPKAEEPAGEAMPVETVEKTPVSVSKNEGNSVSIPAIEKNLDASILVSNLRVELDVPAGYASNTQAKRYLTKLGKIIQLNLKSELLLLSRPPISNKISVEIKYNSSGKCFEVVDIVASSGEKSVDDVVLSTVKKALQSKLNINTDSFGKLSGNPVIIIKL